MTWSTFSDIIYFNVHLCIITKVRFILFPNSSHFSLSTKISLHLVFFMHFWYDGSHREIHLKAAAITSLNSRLQNLTSWLFCQVSLASRLLQNSLLLISKCCWLYVLTPPLLTKKIYSYLFFLKFLTAWAVQGSLIMKWIQIAWHKWNILINC